MREQQGFLHVRVDPSFVNMAEMEKQLNEALSSGKKFILTHSLVSMTWVPLPNNDPVTVVVTPTPTITPLRRTPLRPPKKK